MGATETVTAKVPKEVKEKLSHHGVNVSALIRDTLINEAERLDKEEKKRMADELRDLFRGVDVDEMIKDIRRDRDTR